MLDPAPVGAHLRHDITGGAGLGLAIGGVAATLGWRQARRATMVDG
ncbi:MAG: hypothetical protein ACR2K0_07185 [Acidimicrobiales bacterium]